MKLKVKYIKIILIDYNINNKIIIIISIHIYSTVSIIIFYIYIGEAEGIVAPLLAAYNEHTINVEKMCVFDSLANNDDLVVAPNGGQDMETLAVVDHILSSSKGDKNSSRSEMLSELMLMRAGGQVAMNTQTGAALLATSAR